MGWALLLLLGAVLIIVLELFVPSAGILAFMATGAVIAAIIVGFLHGAVEGLVVVLTAAVALPLVIAILVRVWPHTPLGKRILIQPPQEHEILPETDAERAMRLAVGRRGKATSSMFPSGAVVVDGRSYDAVSESEQIEQGTSVLVVGIRNNRIVVRPLGPDDSSKPPSPAVSDPGDVLSRPIEDLGLDPFSDPLA